MAVLVPAITLILAAFIGIRLTSDHAWVVFLDNLHWTTAYIAGAALAWIGVRTAAPENRAARKWFAWGLSAYAFGQVLWDIQVAVGWNPFPGPSDLFFLMLGACCALGLRAGLQTHVSPSQLRTVALDAGGLSVAVLALTLALYLPRRGDTGVWPLTVMVAYPFGLLTAACIGLVLIPTLRLRADRGWMLFLGGLLLDGWLWMKWNSLTLDNALQDGTVFNAIFSVAALMMGAGAMEWRVTKSTNPTTDRLCEGALRLLPVIVVIGAAIAVVLSWNMQNAPAAAQLSIISGAVIVAALALSRQSLLLNERDQLLKAQNESEQRFRTLVEKAPEAIVVFDFGTRRFIDVNEKACRLFKLDREELMRRGPVELSPPTQPDGKTSMESAIGKLQRAIAGESLRFEWIHRDAEGTDIPCEVYLTRLPSSSSILIRGSIIDIRDRKQAEQHIRQLNRVYAVLSDINQAIVREKDPMAILAAACQIAVDKGKFCMAWTGLTEAATGRLHMAAHAGADPQTLEILHTMLGAERDEDACAQTLRALRTGQHGICNDIEHDPQAARWRAAAQQRHYRAMASLPLKTGSQVIGTFNLYADQPDFFDPEEMRLLDELAVDISFALEISQHEAERRKAEEELRWRTAFFEAQVHSAVDGILVVDSEGQKILQNQRMIDLWKIPPHIVADTDTLKQRDYTQHRVKDPGPFVAKIDYLYAHPDETSVDVVELVDGTVLDRYSAPVRGRDGRYYGRVWIFRDITDRRKAEAALLALNARYARHEAALTTLTRSYVTLPDNLTAVLREIAEVVARTLEVDRVSIWRYDQSRTHIVCSELFEAKTGCHSSGLKFEPGEYPAYSRALNELEIIAARDALHDPRTKEFAEKYHRPLGITSVLDTPLHSQGAMVGVVCCEHIGPMRDWMPDEQTFAVAVANLVSALLAQVERQQLEEQLRQSQKMDAIGQLAGGVAHDFNNVLAVIQMQAGLLRSERGLPSSQMDFASEIEKATERAANLTRQLLLFSRRQAPQPRDLDLNDLISSITKMLQRMLGEHIRMQVRRTPYPLLIRADAGMMDQVLMNLTVNSRDAMPKGGQLIIETAAVELGPLVASQLPGARPGAFVCLSVTDTGVGIPAEVLPKIFEPFFTTKDIGKGTGLGLATVFGIIQQHQGWINVTSEAGQGTTFRVYLPQLTSVNGSSTAPPLLDYAPARGGNETVLVVEDDSALRSGVRNALSRLGYRIIEAPNGINAVEVWNQNRNDIRLLLTDLVMPNGMNGKELAETLQQQNPQLKVIFTSGYSADVAGGDFPLEDGVNFLAKPFPIHKLAQMVRHKLDEH